MIRRGLLFIAIVLFTGEVAGQNTGGNQTLTSFNAERTNDFVSIDWTIRVGFSCSSVYVLHSTDSISFTRIYEYPGICGASTEDKTYSFLHTTPSSGHNYYRVDLGSYGVSGIVPVSMVFYGSDGITIATEVNGQHRAYYYNPGNVSFDMELVDVRGNVIFRQAGIMGDNVEIPRLQTNEIYIVRMQGEDGSVYTARCASSW